jgi:hypothetical protein
MGALCSGAYAALAARSAHGGLGAEIVRVGAVVILGIGATAAGVAILRLPEARAARQAVARMARRRHRA